MLPNKYYVYAIYMYIFQNFCSHQTEKNWELQCLPLLQKLLDYHKVICLFSLLLAPLSLFLLPLSFIIVLLLSLSLLYIHLPTQHFIIFCHNLLKRIQAMTGSLIVYVTIRTNIDMYRNILLLKVMYYLYSDLDSFLLNQISKVGNLKLNSFVP